MDLYISPLNPINFTHKTDENSGELQRSYVQQFIAGDVIKLQVVGKKNIFVNFVIGGLAVRANVINGDDYNIYWHKLNTNSYNKNELLDVRIVVVDNGVTEVYYSTNYIEIVEECDSLKLVEYGNSSNITAFNTYFGDGFPFSLRVPVGFKSTSIKNRIENETFRNQNQELKMLYSAPYTTKTMIIGDGLGVPTWMGTLFNSIFCLSDVTIDGVKYVRSDDSVPEMQGGIDGYPLHIYTMEVEQVETKPTTEVKTINEDFGEEFSEW